MNRSLALMITLLLAISIIPGITSALYTPKNMVNDKIVLAVDLAHGESDKYLGYIQGNITWVEWRNITSPITPDVLEDVDVLILGQPTTSLSPDEMMAIQDWLWKGNKVLWVAGDSDYGGGPTSQEACNDLLAYIGAKLRLELAAVYDDIHNAQRSYRVLTRVMPDNITDLYTYIISENITKPILMHGPDAVIWVDENGVYHDPVNETFPGLIRIVWSYNTSYIGDNNSPPPLVYDLLSYGQGTGNHTFVMVAAEYHEDWNNLIVVSGESPYGDYEPMYSWEYYNVSLDGPQFIKNMIRWFETIIKEKWVTPPQYVLVGQLTDPEGDDNGTGNITYPTNEVFQPGVFDLLKFAVYEDANNIYFKVTVKNLGDNPWSGPNNFSLQNIQIYILTTDDSLSKNYTTFGLNVWVYPGWNYAILMVPGWEDNGQPAPQGQLSAIYDATGKVLAIESLNATFDVYVDPDENNTITARVDKSLLTDLGNIDSWTFAVAVAGYDEHQPLKVRPVVAGNATEQNFGGGDEAAVDAGVQPYVIDLLAPTAQDQYNMLTSYNVENRTLAVVGGLVLGTGQLKTPPAGWIPPGWTPPTNTTTPPTTTTPPANTTTPTTTTPTTTSPTTSPTKPKTTTTPTKTTTPAGGVSGTLIAVIVIVVIIVIIIIAWLLKKK